MTTLNVAELPDHLMSHPEGSSNTQPSTVVVAIDDNSSSLESITATLEREGFEVLTAQDLSTGLEIIGRRHPQIVFCNVLAGHDVIAQIADVAPASNIILLSPHYSPESAVEAIRNGASDLLAKPVSTSGLSERIRQLTERTRTELETQRLDSQMARISRFHGLIGRSPLMLEAFERIERAAPHYNVALITGPSGSGKKLAVRALHQLSPASNGPFVTFACAATPHTAIESELFGYVRGAVSGAIQDKAGLFESAHGGTLVLDGIGELPLAVQTKLLQVLQRREVQRIGSSTPRKVSVRVVATTHRDLDAMAAAKTFLPELQECLRALEIRMPALAERREDLPLLTRHFVEQFASQYGKNLQGLSLRAQALLARYPWPGNVQELESAVSEAVKTAKGQLIDSSDFSGSLSSFQEETGSRSKADLTLSTSGIEAVHARRVLDSLGGDKVAAARSLGVSRATLYRLLARERQLRS